MSINKPYCQKCGKFLFPTDTSGIKCNCPPEPIGVKGWVCPVCGRGNAPWVATCPCQPLPNPFYPLPPQPYGGPATNG